MNKHRLSNGHSSPPSPNLRKKRMTKTLLAIGLVVVFAGCVHHGGYYGPPGVFIGGVGHGGYYGGHHSFGHGGFGHGGGHGH